MFENAFHPISPSCHSPSLLSADPRLCKSPSKPFIRDFSRNAIAIRPLADANAPIAVSRHVIQSESSWTAPATSHLRAVSMAGRFLRFFHLFPVACRIFMCLHVHKEVALKTANRCEVQRRSI